MICKNEILIQQKGHMKVETMDLYLQMAEAFYPLKLGRGRGALGLGGRKAQNRT
jgi:hypothetical protein